MNAVPKTIFNNEHQDVSAKQNYENIFSLGSDRSPSCLRDAILKYNSLLKLPENWDGHCGKSISVGTFLFAMKMLEDICSDPQDVKPQLVPLSYGGIQLEFHSERGDLEIEIERQNRFNVYFEDARTQEECEFAGRNDFREIEALLRRL